VRGRLALLAAIYAAVALAGAIGPYGPSDQHRDVAFAPPTRLHFVDAEGRVGLRPFVYRLESRPGTGDEYEEDRSRAYPIRLMAPGTPYRVAGVLSGTRHLFVVDEPAHLFLLGSDQYGRDVLSRLLHGGQISLAAGLFAAAVAVALGTVLGAAAGYYGRWIDEAIMRVAEVFLALPWLYLLLGVRAMLPLHLDAVRAYLLVIAVLGIVGWARPARLIRAVVSSARARDHVLAARAFGAGDVHVLSRHILPDAAGVALTQLAILIPQYTLAEVTLSFFGLGISEPVPSWGNMLAAAQRYEVLLSYWWMLVPGIALGPVFLLYYSCANALHRRMAHPS
jgi:peptide/nickel transport system permease protein